MEQLLTYKFSVVARNLSLCDQFKEELSASDKEFIEYLRAQGPEKLSEESYERLSTIAGRIRIYSSLE